MARGAEAKLRRRNRKKNENDEVIDMFGEDDEATSDLPMPNAGFETKDDDNVPLPKQKKKTKNAKGTDGESTEDIPRIPSSANNKGIKTTPLILLFLMVGTALLPALIYAGDFISSHLSKSDFSGSIGYTLGIGTVPHKRTTAFYEKHAPEKVKDVPKILSKHYGGYPKLIKQLERKYQDYGYFIGWEEDEALFTHFKEQTKEVYDIWLKQYWNRHAPQALKTAFRNIRYNLGYLYKKSRRLYRKHVWPLIEPIFGVPKGGEAQKRKDAAEARKRREQASGGSMASGRRKNRDYRDDVED